MDTLWTALSVLGSLVLVLIVFNLIILVHEWGHFLAARWRGLKIEKFQIWFGRPLWKKTWNGVQYGLGSIPAGGFVALPQMAPMEAIEGRGEDGVDRASLPPISPLDKAIVAFAGPLFSLLLAFAFAVVVYFAGHPVDPVTSVTVIGEIQPGSPASKSGLRLGDRVVRIDGQRIDKFFGMIDSVTWGIISSPNDVIEFEVERDGRPVRVPVATPRADSSDRQWWQHLVLRPAFRQVGIGPAYPVRIAKVYPNSPAAEAGLQVGDVPLEVAGEPVYSPANFAHVMQANPGKPVAAVFERGGGRVEVAIVPRLPAAPASRAKTPSAGIQFEPLSTEMKYDNPLPHRQVVNALRTMAATLGAVLTPKSDVSAAHLSGPVGIMHVYTSMLMSPDGWRLVLWFSVVLNVNLAVLNLLPFPVLDGGHITMAALEAVRRKPLNFRFLEMVQMACVMLLFGFMIFVTLKDFGDLGGRAADRGGESEDIRFDPPGGGPGTGAPPGSGAPGSPAPSGTP
jgi:regulator of sigma E protease